MEASKDAYSGLKLSTVESANLAAKTEFKEDFLRICRKKAQTYIFPHRGKKSQVHMATRNKLVSTSLLDPPFPVDAVLTSGRGQWWKLKFWRLEEECMKSPTFPQ